MGPQFLDDLERVADLGAGQTVQAVDVEGTNRTPSGIVAEAVRLGAS